MIADTWAIVKVVAIMAQLVYWMLLRDDGREQVVYEACLWPEGRPER